MADGAALPGSTSRPSSSPQQSCSRRFCSSSPSSGCWWAARCRSWPPSGWALAFQELGHFVGTILLGLPLALLLGIKREAIGATFSVGREPSLAIIGEKYGMDSPEGRGVLAEYLTGTVFGAVFIAILAGFVASLNIFHPSGACHGFRRWFGQHDGRCIRCHRRATDA